MQQIFFNLFGILLNSLIGGVVLLVSNARIRDGSVVVSRDLLPATDQFANEDPEHAD